MDLTAKAQAPPSAASLSTQVQSICDAQRRAFLREGPPDYAKRAENLNKLLKLTIDYEDRLAEAVSKDFGHRSRFETALAETFVVLSGIKHAQRNLKRWMKSRPVPTALHFRPGRNEIISQPLGVVGIISPWNYPFYLAFSPVTSALAAGNRVVLKPSEITPRTSELLKEMVASEFAPEEFTVITGGREVGEALARTPLDHLFFTGSTRVGREVALAAAHNLTPVTLELGGKSPAIISDDYSIATAAERLIVGKMVNCGQTCIAPDYVFVPQARLHDFLANVHKAAAKLYPRREENSDYTAIVNEHHLERLASYLRDAAERGAQIVEINPSQEPVTLRKMPLHLVVHPSDAMKVMQEEIFGPILPVLTYKSLDEAISYINTHPRPLALYWFGNNTATRDRVLTQTISGGATVNDTLWHICQESLPFGGVGASGIGTYHGIYGFKTFSKEKGVFHQRRWNGAWLLYPPYGRLAEMTLKVLKKIV